ncbi:MAG: NAD(P)-binding domain-containing protein, partial [Candidatus Bathyarchaeota archaeon]|nr:NAD(P)-binding domain-containing protein [Candidatus Bathyarchaeota archaeon]
MKIGFIGLGRMGLRMVYRILEAHEVVAHDIDSDAVKRAAEIGA